MRTNAVRTITVQTNAVRTITVQTNAVRTNIYWGDEVTKCGADKCIIGGGELTNYVNSPNVNVYFGGGRGDLSP